YRVMPGGLTRVALEAGGRFISMQRGGASKDTWVLSEKPVEEVSLLHPAGHDIELRRVGNNLPSRLADNFYWLGRYAERADATARMLRSTLLRFNPENTGGAMPLLTPILDTLEAQGQIMDVVKRPELRQNAEALEAELLAVIFDSDRPGSLRQIAAQLQRLAMMVRDRLSTDTWRVLTEFDDRVMAPVAQSTLLAGEAIGLLNEVILSLASFHGLAMENMTRAQGWRFLDMGHRLERAVYLCNFTQSALRSPEADNASLLETVLEVADCSITYRSRYNLLPHIAAVYDLVLLDETSPRSLLYQLNQLVKHFDRLPREKQSALPSPGQRLLLDSVTRLRLADPTELGRLSKGWNESAFAEVIKHVGAALPKLSDAIAVSYFAHSGIYRQ
ncbi:MAG: circularly permuted type 2 ATP-grasp protein, partial [Verrucomicrobiota bacterium]